MDSTPYTTDYTLSSSISEIDSLSDSDWLDLASNRGLDADSVSDHDISVPHSRRSSISLGSSREGDIEAWEGFADDSADERQSDKQASVTAEDAEFPAVAIGEQEAEEERRVREALDQSMVSTLSASRTSSHGLQPSTVHNSLRDLRLSFPDPLTSSREEEHKFYAEASPSETNFSVTESEDLSLPPTLPDMTETARTPSDTLNSSAPAQAKVQLFHDVDLSIFLYGSSSDMKWSFVETLIQKIATGGDWVLTVPSHFDSTIHLFCLDHFYPYNPRFNESVSIAVYDHTNDNLTLVDKSASETCTNHPSLAIIFLPTIIPPAVQCHSVYLPVFVPFPSLSDPSGSGEPARRAAQDSWDLLGIPTNKTLRLNGDNYSPVFDSSEIHTLTSWHAHTIFQRLTRRPIPVFALTLIALVSLILSVVIHLTFHSPTSVTSSSVGLSVKTLPPTLNNTIITPGVTGPETSAAVVPSTLRDLALAVINPSQPESSGTVTATGRPAERRTRHRSPLATHDHEPILLPDRFHSTKDVTIRDVHADLSLPEPGPSRSASAVKFAAVPTKSLNIRFVDSLSEVATSAMKALTEVVYPDAQELVNVVQHDMQEITEAIDVLLQTISKQTTAILQESRTKAKTLRERLEYRNERAREKAKKLKVKADTFVSYANTQLRQRAMMARKKAHALKDGFVNSEAVKAYRRAHEESVDKLKEQLYERSKNMKRRRGKAKAKAKARVGKVCVI